jgi:hypothetical protein
MALKKQITLVSNFGDNVLFNEAYIKVENLTGNKSYIRIDVSIQKKVDEQIVDRRNFTFTPDLGGKNFISQAYDHLKTLAEFSGAIDC